MIPTIFTVRDIGPTDPKVKCQLPTTSRVSEARQENPRKLLGSCQILNSGLLKMPKPPNKVLSKTTQVEMVDLKLSSSGLIEKEIPKKINEELLLPNMDDEDITD